MLIICDIQKCAKTISFFIIFEEFAYAQCNDNFAVAAAAAVVGVVVVVVVVLHCR